MARQPAKRQTRSTMRIHEKDLFAISELDRAELLGKKKQKTQKWIGQSGEDRARCKGILLMDLWTQTVRLNRKRQKKTNVSSEEVDDMLCICMVCEVIEFLSNVSHTADNTGLCHDAIHSDSTYASSRYGFLFDVDENISESVNDSHILCRIATTL